VVLHLNEIRISDEHLFETKSERNMGFRCKIRAGEVRILPVFATSPSSSCPGSRG